MKELKGHLDPWASLRREELLQLLDQLDPWIDKLDKAVIQAAESRPLAVCLMPQAGVGPVTGTGVCADHRAVSRFANSEKVVSYLGRIRTKKALVAGNGSVPSANKVTR